MEKSNPIGNTIQLGRRAFLQGGTLLLAGASVSGGKCLALAAEDAEDNAKPTLRVGVVTDLHYADKPSAGTRHFRESLDKFAEAARQFNEAGVGLLLNLGDSADSADSIDVEKSYLKKVVDASKQVACTRRFVVGNHCVWTLTKPEFLKIVDQERSYDSFDEGGVHFVILDACFRSDGTPYGNRNFDWTDANIPGDELKWLEADLRKTSHKTIVCVHQCLDVPPPLGIKNAAEVRKVLEASGKVLAVLQGHHHPGNYQEIGGIHYCTFQAMIEGAGQESNAYARLDLFADHSIQVVGFRKQPSYHWA